MHPVAFEILGKEIRWYGVMAALGFIAATMLMKRIRGNAKLSADQVGNITLIAMISGVLGARLFYVIQFWHQFKNNYAEIIRIDHGGLVFYGGFILAVISILTYCKKNDLSILAVLDVAAPAIAIGHAAGRFGCFMNGCCYGKACDVPWGVTYPETTELGLRFAEQAIHPVQIYEIIGNVILCTILLLVIKKLRTGQTAALYLTLYGVLRFVDEFFRGDHTDFVLGLFTPAQTIGIILIPVGLIWFTYISHSEKKLATE